MKICHTNTRTSAHIDAVVGYAPRSCFTAAVKSSADRQQGCNVMLLLAVANINTRSCEKHLGPVNLCLDREGAN